MDILYTVDEVAAILKLDDETIRRWLLSGKLKGNKISQVAWRIPQTSIDEFLAGNSNVNATKNHETTTQPEVSNG